MAFFSATLHIVLSMEISNESLKENPTNRLGLYVVQAGDSIQSICAKHNLPPILLICSNHLKDEPKEATMLVLPKSSGKLHTVQVGESVESLCQKYAMTKESFQQKNGCTYVYPSLVVVVE